MKKIQFAVLALVTTMSLSAENTTKLRIWIGGEKTEYELSTIDSLTFFTTTIEGPAAPVEPLEGVFSVSPDKQVHFSKGNLQYTQSTNTWAFAENQYGMIGGANINDSDLADKIDLFGWSGSTGIAKWGVSVSEDSEDYSGDFVDWGMNMDDGITWRTLSTEEWQYLIFYRTDAGSKYGVASIYVTTDDSERVNGLVILPDNWICPEGATFRGGMSNDYGEQAFGDYQSFSLEQWKKLESAGAVFLPATGRREGNNVYSAFEYGNYWSSSCSNGHLAYDFSIDSDGLYLGGDDPRSYGYAVRLVQDL